MSSRANFGYGGFTDLLSDKVYADKKCFSVTINFNLDGSAGIGRTAAKAVVLWLRYASFREKTSFFAL